MITEDRLDEDMIETRQKKAFTERPVHAYEKFKRMKYTGESVDIYINNMKRLAELAGYLGRRLDQMAKLL